MKNKHTLFLVLCVLKCLAIQTGRLGSIDELEALAPEEAPAKRMLTSEDPQQSQNSTTLSCRKNFTFPIVLGYINEIEHWEGLEMLEDIMLPGYSKKSDIPYNFLVFTFWRGKGNKTTSSAAIWEDPLTHLRDDKIRIKLNITNDDTDLIKDSEKYRQRNKEITKALKKTYNDKGIKVLVSAYGALGNATINKTDPNQSAKELAAFVEECNFDGVDVDWEEKNTLNSSFYEGKGGDQWVVDFIKQLREKLPCHIITFAPEAAVFNDDIEQWKGHSYMNIHNNLKGSNGQKHLIDFYNIQFYNAGNNTYANQTTLLKTAAEKQGDFVYGTSVSELMQKGISGSQIVIGKPISKSDADNGHITNFSDYGEWLKKFHDDTANSTNPWKGGVSFWQVSSDLTGEQVKKVADKLKSLKKDE